MRKLDRLSLTENMRFTENFLLEIGISKYLPFVVRIKSFKSYIASFAIDIKDIEVEENGEWVPLSNSSVNRWNMDKVTYTVNINGGTNSILIPIRRDGFDTEIKVKTHSLTFSNDITTMSNLKGNVGILIFSTIAKILITFTEIYKKDFQCITFTPAQDKLIGTYEILSREAEKQSDLIYANKETGKRERKWYLINKSIWNKFLLIKGR